MKYTLSDPRERKKERERYSYRLDEQLIKIHNCSANCATVMQNAKSISWKKVKAIIEKEREREDRGADIDIDQMNR